ncbi:MAG: hypothetical protein ACLQAH_05090 [Limisphaerales bacterium]
MNRCINPCKSALAAGLAAALVVVLPAAAAPAAPEVVTRSVFTMPTNPKEGRDPFFPDSNRPYESATAGKPHVADVSSLVLRGISGSSNQRLAIINSHTIGVGDEQDLVTPQGRLHIRCIEIKTNSVVIESGGSIHELKYNDNP